MIRHRIARISLTMMALAVAAAVLRADETPYLVPVVGDDAIVHGGPGSTHYGTDRLAPGTWVEVWRDDPGGWKAIRPPEGSFSLVLLDEVEMLSNGLARVVTDETVAWVGTRLTAVEKPMWQVRLRKGEVVEVLGIVDREKYDLESDQPDWVQIKPPAGEFRWIAADNLDLAQRRSAPSEQPAPSDDWSFDIAEDHSSSASGAGTTGTQSDNWSFDSWDEGSIQPIDRNATTGNNHGAESFDVQSGQSSSGASSGNDAASGWRPARQTIANFVDQRSRFMAESNPVSAPVNSWNGQLTRAESGMHTRANVFAPADDSWPDNSAIANPGGAQAALATGGVAGTGTDLLTQLELRLTSEMLKPPPQWDLVDLAREVQQVREATPDPAARAVADRLLEKIRNCREIQAGYEAIDGPGPDDKITRIPDTLQAAGVVPVTTELLHEYDAFGWLTELVRDGGLGPGEFAIQDEQGRITHHITAPPGLNLRRYLNQRVGIIGNRGFNQQLKLDHVTAERIIAVDQLRR